MHTILSSLFFMVLLSSCAHHVKPKAQAGMANNEIPQQRQFDADKKICWAEIKDKYDCFPPYLGNTVTHLNQNEVYDLFIEAKRFCDSDSLSPQRGGSETLIRLISYLGECLYQKNWADVSCCNKY